MGPTPPSAGRSTVFLLFITLVLVGCSKQRDANEVEVAFDEHLKGGDLSLTIIGDYFHPSYVAELAEIAKALSPDARQIFLCTPKYQNALEPFLTANGIRSVEYVTFDRSSTILTQWARDIAIAGVVGVERAIVVSPDKHAASREEAEATARLIESVLPDYDVRIAPFVFETGNLAFVNAGGERTLIVGRKLLFDNLVYQQRPWGAGLEGDSLFVALADVFGVDHVRVVGRAPTRPAARMYFEYHLDMGMVILEDNRAVVGRLHFGDDEQGELARAVREEQPVITPFLEQSRTAEQVVEALSDRLQTVEMEYEDYAALLDTLGVEVYRSDVDWRHVVASMSWTNVIQAGARILMPLYPDSLHGITRFVREQGGRLSISVDVSEIGEETFEFSGYNLQNYELYQSLGYEVVAIPEYLHYMMGGIHCFVNVLE